MIPSHLDKMAQYQKSHWFISALILLCSVYCMSGILFGVRRYVGNMAAEYIAGTHSMAFVTVPNEELAKKLATGLLEQKLAACVNIIPGVKSMYRWKDKIEEDGELILMIKTRTARVPELTKFVRENHSYDVAEVISTPIQDGNAPYLDWISKEVPAAGEQ